MKGPQGAVRAGRRRDALLDEIAEIPVSIQSRLLRVLQERTFVPLGDTVPRTVDVRLVSATHQSRAAVEAGRFRADLMYRVRVVPLFIPPLRERVGDVAVLVDHFVASFNQSHGHLRQVTAVRSLARAALMAYGWPGNVRELANVIEYAFVVGQGPVLTLDDLTPELRRGSARRSAAGGHVGG
ncbi:MAG: sigma 54-interacting transcriptional regulator [bacterium]